MESNISIDNFKDKWISVQEYLPTDFEEICEHDYVLLLAENPENGPRGLYALGQWYGEWIIFGGEGVHSCSGTYPLKSKDISHWKIL